MNERSKSISKVRTILVFIMGLLVIISLHGIAYAEWDFGIGTGPQLLAIKGDVGMDTAIAAIQLDIDFDDMSDLTDAAFGFGGYATNGKWLIQYKLGQLQLEKSAVQGLRDGNTLSANAEFDYTQLELTIGYPFIKKPHLIVSGYAGARYLRQELDLVITGTGFLGVNRSKSIDESWVDALLGISVNVPFAEKWNWNIKADAGYGGSEGTYLIASGLTWRFYGGWSATISADYGLVNYENGSKGDSDWYL